jgi:hypothetical protein
MSDPEEPVDLAERVATIALGVGIQTTLIGAYALAAYHYVRATADIDLASAVVPDQLYVLKSALEDAGLNATVNHPDEYDSLGGTVMIWETADDEGVPVAPVEVVNYINPYRPRPNPASEAIRNAISMQGRALKYPRLADLVALKLYGGSRRDKADIIELLVKNPDEDIELIRSTCKHYGYDEIDELIDEAADERRRR